MSHLLKTYLLICLLMACESKHIVFKGDSGFITKEPGLSFLIDNKLIDTPRSRWSYYKDNDTIGKYYKLNKNYIACVTVIDENLLNHFLLLEATPDEKIQKAIPYYQGNHSCCWGDHFDGFGKLNDYFYLRTCGTGTAYCASDLYIFKDISDQESQESVLEWYWLGYTGKEDQFEQLSSTMKLKKDSIFMHYKMEKGNSFCFASLVS